MLAVAILSVGNFNFILPIAAGHIEQNNSWNLIILTNKKKKKTTNVHHILFIIQLIFLTIRRFWGVTYVSGVEYKDQALYIVP